MRRLAAHACLARVALPVKAPSGTAKPQHASGGGRICRKVFWAGGFGAVLRHLELGVVTELSLPGLKLQCNNEDAFATKLTIPGLASALAGFEVCVKFSKDTGLIWSGATAYAGERTVNLAKTFTAVASQNFDLGF